MGIFQSIAKGFSLSGKLLNVVLIFFALNFIMGLAMLPFSGADSAGNPQTAAIGFIMSIISVLIFVFLQGGALGVIRDLIKNNSLKIADFVNYGKKYYLKILGLFGAILVVAVIAMIILALLAGGILAVANTPFMRALLTAIVIIISLFAVVLLIFPIYIIVLEDRGPIESIKLGLKASMENFWRVLGLFLLLLVVSFILAFLVLMLAGLVSGALPMTAGRI